MKSMSLDKGEPQCAGYWEKARKASHPHIIDAIKTLDLPRQCRRNDGTQACPNRTLVFAKLREPWLLPRLRMLAFPQNSPANRPTGSHNPLKEVGTVPANPDSLKLVPRKLLTKSGFKLKLLNLSLLRGLLAPSPEFLYLLPHIVDDLVLLG